MRIIKLNDVRYRVHPIYDYYAASKAGQIIEIKQKKN